MSALQQAFISSSPNVRYYDGAPSSRATIAAMVAADFVAVTLAAVVALLLIKFFRGPVSLEAYWRFCPELVAPVIGYGMFGLYEAGLFDPVQELKRTAVASTLFYLGLGTCTFLYREQDMYSRAALTLGWALTLIAVPAARICCRSIASRSSWWGYSVGVIGTPAFVERTLASLARKSGPPLLPVLTHCPNSPIAAAELDQICDFLERTKPHYVLLGSCDAEILLVRIAEMVPRVLFVPELAALIGLRTTARNCGGFLALELSNQLRIPETLVLKRLLDFTAAGLLAIILAPVAAFIAALVKLTSSGPVFYGHWRYGKYGRRFKALKFRSMLTNGDEVFQQHILMNEPARIEWLRNHKLRRDPRVTGIGRFLRATSLDELPQIWNVLRNEMSLVGPRPVVEEETLRYGRVFDVYKRVPPGITGLWQVSGRNNTTYEERIRLDEYYVRNWSIWLDLYILLRTVSVVLSREGAN